MIDLIYHMYIDYNYVINLNNYIIMVMGKKIKIHVLIFVQLQVSLQHEFGGQVVKDLFYGYRGEGSNFVTNIL